MTRWDRFLDTFFNAKVMAKYLPDILSGMVLTIELALAVVVAGLLAGLILALVRSLGIRPINWLIIFVVDVFRSLPPLVVIVLVYFGLPSAGVSPSAFVSTWMSLSLVLMAFAEEIFWAGITSTPKGQWEASRSTGLSFAQTLLYVILPQALRITIAPLTNRTIAITKGTALGTVVALHEILGMASSAVSNSYNPSPLMMGAAAYLVLFLPVVVAARWIETRFAMEEIVQAFFNTEIAQAALPIVLQGLLNTVLLSLMVVPLGFIGGLILAMLALSKSRLIRWPLMAWVDFFRAFPPLVLLILLFAGLPFAGLELGGFACVAIAFFLNTGAYYGEILRAGIESIPRGQVEAARSTGLNGPQAMIYVVLPQAVRNVLPDLLSNTLEVVKLTALGSVVAVPELLFQARQAQSVTYNATPIVMAAVIYFLILWPVVRLLSRLENRALHAMAR